MAQKRVLQGVPRNGPARDPLLGPARELCIISKPAGGLGEIPRSYGSMFFTRSRTSAGWSAEIESTPIWIR